jgi:pimeloyl-ACP methyl ester carboxylesterase
MAKALVLVHGAWHGAWCWQPTLTALAVAGIKAHTVHLPFEGLEADATALRGLLDQIDGQKVVVGHSYGGMVISEATADRDDIAELVYLCALMLEIGDDPVATFREDPDASKLFAAAELDPITGIATIPADCARDFFYNDCTQADAEAATKRLRPFPMPSLAGVTAEPWRKIPSTYVVCTEDGTVPPSLQRPMSAHARRVVEWPTGHSPFMSRPDLMVELLRPMVAAN